MKPVVNAVGLDGNTVSVVTKVVSTLRNAGMRTEAQAVKERAFNGTYDDMLRVCMEYVEFDFSGRSVLNRAGERSLPAGNYVVADPCYILDNRIYDQLLELTEAWSGETPVFYASYAELSLWIVPTTHGDGSYHGSDGSTYLVDSGTIACIQVPVSDPELFFQSGWENYPQFTVNRPFSAELTKNGEIVFGSFLTIPTDGDVCGECGNSMKWNQCNDCGYCASCCQCEAVSEEEEDEDED